MTPGRRRDGPTFQEERAPNPEAFASTVAGRAANGRFAGLFASASNGGSVVLRAAVALPGTLDVVTCALAPSTDGRQVSYPALTPALPAASWYEREIADLFDLFPTGHPRMDPLVLPRGPRTPAPCFGQARPWDDREAAPQAPDEAALPAHVSGEGMFTFPFGPVRSGIFESVQYLVETPGEDILHVRARVYHKHRGIEGRFEGLTPSDGVLLAERVEGVASVAHALAFCQAVESASGVPAHSAVDGLPRGAALVRVLHAELERVVNHLDSMVRHTEAAGQAVANARLAWHKERALRLRSKLCGHRFSRNVLVLGGVTGPPELSPSDALCELASIESDVRADTHLLMTTSSFIDRLRGTGVVTPEVASRLGALGPLARASGSEEDLRTHRPYSAYGLVPVPEHRYRDSGDALARQLVRLEETWGSFRLCQSALEALVGEPADGPWSVPLTPVDGTSWGWAEAPQGEVLYMIEIDDGRLRRVKPRSASFHNLSIFPNAFGGDILTDFAFIEASFGLSMAGVSN